MENGKMDLQKLSYFTEGNTFTGSRTKDKAAGKLLRYLVRPDRENGKLLAWCWEEDVCFELAKEPMEREFPMDDEGLAQAGAWLREQYDSIKMDLTPGGE